MTAAVDRLLRLTGRERLSLGIGALIVLAGLGAALLPPLAERRQASVAALQEARALDAWVSARAEEMLLLQAAVGPGPVPPMGLSGLQRSLDGAGLTDSVASLAVRGSGEIELRFDAVDFQALMNWITQLSPVWGYRMAGFRVERGTEPGLVRARFDLMPQQ